MKLALLAFIPLVAVAAACGAGNSGEPGATPTSPASASPSATPPARTPTSTPGATPSPATTPGRKIVDAPIDGLDVVVRESFPPQYAVTIVSGLPSGCAVFNAAEVTSRAGTEITIRVTNTEPDDPNLACTAIYGTHESTVELGSDFTSGVTYTVRVNDESIDFTAQ
jgi:hypothetical protein